jgi:hypothetical protein
MEEEFRILSDDDGHIYFIPLDQVEAFYEWASSNAGDDYTYDHDAFARYAQGYALSCYTFRGGKLTE